MSSPSHQTTTDPARTTTVVLVDPSSPDGHSSLNVLTDDDTDLLVVVLLSGRASFALHEYAHHEETSPSHAAWVYLDQVATGLERPGRTIGTISAGGPDAAADLADIAIEHDAARVVLPSSALRHDRTIARRLAQLAPVAISTPEIRVLSPLG